MQTAAPFPRISPDSGPVWHAIWSPGRIERNRRIYDYELVYFANGSGRLITDSGSFECRKGCAVIIPPKLMHCTVALTQLERWCLHFDWFGECRAHREAPEIFVYQDEAVPFREELAASDPQLPGMEFPLFRNHIPPEILLQLRRYFLPHPDTPAGRLARQGILLQILGLVLQEPENGGILAPESGALFFKAKNLVDTRYLECGLQVSGIAAECGVTANHLTKLFRRALGMSLMDYIQSLRLRHSRKLLLESALTIREVAYASGFNDPNYFSRFFRKKTGRTPAGFRAEAGTETELSGE